MIERIRKEGERSVIICLFLFLETMRNKAKNSLLLVLF